MQKRVEKKVLAYCKKHRMFEQGDSVVVGVSGGADSVCLLFVLLSLQKEWNLKLQVVHVNHGIRPDAGEDAAYVRSLCDKYNLPFTLVEKDIPALAESLGCSEEEAGRMARYDSFEQALQKTALGKEHGKIAVAHNANDRAETMLFHLFRGTGLTGLGGIRPVREHIVRPILCLERAEIEAYLETFPVSFCHDSTNDSDDYTRNKIRHHVLGYAEQEIVKGCVGNMARTADILAETEDYIEEQVREALQECVSEEMQQTSGSHTDKSGGKEAGAYCVNVSKYKMLHKVIQKRLILTLLKELSPRHRDIGAVHVESIQSLLMQEGNRSIHLPYGIRGIREYDTVFLKRQEESESDREDKERRENREQELVLYKDDLSREPYRISFGEAGRHLVFQVLDAKQEGINCKDIPQNQYTKWFDYDKIIECLTIRTRREGDFLSIRSGEEVRHKKLKDYMIDEKIPPQQREELLLLAEGQHVLWLVGYRISEYYKVNAETKQILRMSYEMDDRMLP